MELATELTNLMELDVDRNADATAATILELVRDRDDCPIFYLGRQNYARVWALQRVIHALRVEGKIGDLAFFVEHEPVYTFGKNASDLHLLDIRPGDAAVVRSDRGGDITYHGPGQLVGYPIVNLKDHRSSVSWYMRGLEGMIINMLAECGIAAERNEGLTGVWYRSRKLAALGVKLAKWTTMHGFAINVDVPMRYFDGMIPCGIHEYGVANMNEFVSPAMTVRQVAEKTATHLRQFLEG